MLKAHRSLVITVLVVVGCAGGVAGAAVTDASVSQDGAITIAHETVSGTELTLLVQGKQLYGPPRYRDADFTFSDEPPEVEDADGGVMSESGGSSAFHRVAERGRPPLAVESWPATCARVAVAGTATPSVARVRVLHEDGSATPVRLRKAPPGWHYRGRYFGAFVRTASPPRSMRAYARDGRVLRTANLPHDAC